EAGRLHRLPRRQPVQPAARAGLPGRLRAHGLWHGRHHGRARRGPADWDFAKAYGLDVIRTVQPPDDWEGEAYTGDGPAINSEWLDGKLKDDAIVAAIDWLEQRGIGERKVNYRLRDWLVSRQRFWGCPIPVVYCPDDVIVPVPGDD